MSGEALYERYKDALKRGHVASLRNRLDEAVAAYAEAATIAPERSTPHTSAGTALLRHGQPADALPFFTAALALAPHDEAALVGRAQSLEATGDRGEAAETYDAVAEIRVAGDRLVEALDAARRALELAEGRDRRRSLRRMVDRLRTSELDDAARAGLDQALQLLDWPPVDTGAAGAGDRVPAAAEPSPASSAEGEPAPPRIPGALERDVPDGVDTEAIARAADEALDEGRPAEAVAHLLDAAVAHRRSGNLDAALDACYQGLSAAPDDLDLHLALVELYGDRGWAELASGKLDLLERQVTLDGGDEALARVAAARSGDR